MFYPLITTFECCSHSWQKASKAVSCHCSHWMNHYDWHLLQLLRCPAVKSAELTHLWQSHCHVAILIAYGISVEAFWWHAPRGHECITAKWAADLPDWQMMQCSHNQEYQGWQLVNGCIWPMSILIDTSGFWVISIIFSTLSSVFAVHGSIQSL